MKYETKEERDRLVAFHIPKENRGGTHWDGCEEDHGKCALLKMRDVCDALERERDAWKESALREREALTEDGLRIVALEKDIAIVLKAFDDGIFVRDVSQDHRSDWAIRCAPPLAAVGRLAATLEDKP